MTPNSTRAWVSASPGTPPLQAMSLFCPILIHPPQAQCPTPQGHLWWPQGLTYMVAESPQLPWQ